MKIQFNSNYGHFATEITAVVPDGSNRAICEEGLANILYRVCGSYVDKKLGIKKGDKRKEVEYDEASVPVIEKAVKEKIVELGTNAEDAEEGAVNDYAELALAFRVTGKHEFGEGGASAMVMATTLVDTFLGDEAMEAAYRAVFGAQGMKDAETAERDALVAFAHSKGLGIRPTKK